jgi:2-polyprenyl-3-methyl-5-hydroxy-6-metoxy-1,4-benzoquinol methylase
MDKSVKEQKLRKFAKSVINDPRYKGEIEYLLRYFNLKEEQLIQEYVNYDLDVFSYGNEIYESIVMRLVLHLHNLLDGSWHKDRQKIILEFLEKINFETAVDVGFGVPTKYLKSYLLNKSTKKFTLVDFYESAFDFAKVILSRLSSSYNKTINFEKKNMDDMEYLGDYDIFLFQDSIEHTKDPTGYLKKTVSLSPKKSKFILSLPIGPEVPSHYIEFKDKENAIKWLENLGLKIEESKDIFVNPRVDLFANDLDKKFYNFIVLCSKK